MTDRSDKISVLIVDDKMDKLVSLEACLSDLGLDIVRAQSGRDALRCLLNQDFAAILLDVNMPGMDGFETATLIRQRKSSQSTPILFITALGDEPFVARGYALGAVDYILTPVIPEVLRTKVMVFVELYRKTLEISQQAQKLQQRADQLAALAAEVAQAEQRERRRLAQVLHDNLQQLLVAALMRLGAFHAARPDKNAQLVAQLDDLLRKSIETSRSLTGELSPSILYDAGLVPAFEWLSRQVRKNHGLIVEVECSTPTNLEADDMRSFMFHAVRELLFNCVKHAGVKKARVLVTRIGDRVRVTVVDRGAGFDPTMLDSLSGKGDHYGLFSIRERARLMNGELHIESAPGRGTSISLTLPDRIEQPPCESNLLMAAAIPSPAVELPVSEEARSTKVNGTKIRVLLADDHEILRKGLAVLLGGQADIEVVGEVTDGLAALETARRIRPDVIVMDVGMPGMNGVEATRLIKREQPQVQVIGLSMHSREDMGAAMTLAGASAYLSKDGPPEALVALIRQIGLAAALARH